MLERIINSNNQKKSLNLANCSYMTLEKLAAD